jgi:hypothetical protein
MLSFGATLPEGVDVVERTERVGVGVDILTVAVSTCALRARRAGS